MFFLLIRFIYFNVIRKLFHNVLWIITIKQSLSYLVYIYVIQREKEKTMDEIQYT